MKTFHAIRENGSGFLRKGSWGLADQMLISLTHFLTMVLLARGLGLVAFGAFSLVYGALLFANSFQSALIIHPHSVLSAGRRGRAYSAYTTSTAVTQVLLSVLAAALALAAGAVLYVMGREEASLLIALAPCVIAAQGQEFVRRVLYNEIRFRAAFINDLICYGGQTVLLAVLWYHHWLTGSAALYAIAAASAVAVLPGVWTLRQGLAGPLRLRAASRQNWQFGRWLAGAEMGYWFSSQIYLYLAAALLGTAATGALKAASTIFGPSRVLETTLKNVLPNRFARTLASHGKTALKQQVKTIYWSVVPVIGSYCLFVALLARPLPRLLFGEQFDESPLVLVLYSVVVFTGFMAQVVSSALKAAKLTRQHFLSRMYASLLAIPLGWVIITLLGVEGAVVGMWLTSLIMNWNNWRAYRGYIASGDESGSTPMAPRASEADETRAEPAVVAGTVATAPPATAPPATVPAGLVAASSQ